MRRATSPFLLLALAAALPWLAPAPAHARDASGLGCSPALAGVADGPVWGAEVLAEVNRHRRSLGLVAVRPDPVLSRAAAWKARDVIVRPYGGGHEDPGLDGLPPRTAQQRVQTCGFTADLAFENLLMGVELSGARDAVATWLRSPPHRANIENPAWRYAGTGWAVGTEELFPGQPMVAVSQIFSASPAPRVPLCGGDTPSVVTGGRLDLAPLTCRAEGEPRPAAPPARGRLEGLTYLAPSRPGLVTLRLRWPDTGAVHDFFIQVLRPRVAATLAAPVCAAGRCRVRYRLSGASDWALPELALRVERRAGGRWVRARSARLLARRATATVRLAPGSYRMRVLVSVPAPQRAVPSPWRAVRVA